MHPSMSPLPFSCTYTQTRELYHSSVWHTPFIILPTRDHYRGFKVLATLFMVGWRIGHRQESWKLVWLIVPGKLLTWCSLLYCNKEKERRDKKRARGWSLTTGPFSYKMSSCWQKERGRTSDGRHVHPLLKAEIKRTLWHISRTWRLDHQYSVLCSKTRRWHSVERTPPPRLNSLLIYDIWLTQLH